MNAYLILYKGAYIASEGGLSAGEEAKFTCTAMSEEDAITLLVNRELVHHVISVERIKE